MSKLNYRQKRRNRRKEFYRIRLGILQMLYKPYLFILVFPIILLTIYICINRSFILELFNVPEMLLEIYKYSFYVLIFLLPSIFILGIFELIGYMTARDDEASLEEVFSGQEQRNGYPILINKKRIKKTNAIMRIFYTEIPMRIWVERQEEIQDLMNVRFVEKIKHADAHGRKIMLVTVSGRESNITGDLYDDEL